MRSFCFVLAVVFVPVLHWRTMRERRISAKELAISGGISAVISAVLLFVVSK